MTNIEKQKKSLRESLKEFKEGIDYKVSSSEIDAWEGKMNIYEVYSPKLKKALKEILSSIRNWEDDEGFIYKIKESENSISVSRSLKLDSFSGERETEKFRETFTPLPSGGSEVSGLGDLKKHCSSCNRDFPSNANFCSGCREALVVLKPQIQEIIDQESQQQQRPFFPKPKGN